MKLKNKNNKRSSRNQVAAFFDFDGTLTPTNAIHYLVHLHPQLRFSLWRTGAFACRLIVYGLVDCFSRNVFDRLFYRNYRGLCARTCRTRSAAELKSIIRSRMYAEAIDCIEAHRAAGHKLVMVTGSPDFIVRPLARELGFDLVVSGGLKEEGGLFTGALARRPLHRSEKSLEVSELAKQYEIDLARSFAYGDSSNDIEMLTMVGNPVAVNGDLKLRRAARAGNWGVAKWGRETGRQDVAR